MTTSGLNSTGSYQFAPGEKPPNIPAWQWVELQSLAAENALSGIDPTILGAIDQAESSGQGGYTNSEGYGGFFGLGVNTQYPGGFQVNSQVMGSTSPTAFDYQAETAASEFASLLASHGGNAYAAESAYQGGSSEGTSIFSSLNIPAPQTGWQTSQSEAILAGSPTISGYTNPDGSTTLTSSSGPTMPPNITIRAVLMIVGLILLFIAVKELFESGHSATQTVLLPGQNIYRKTKSAGKSAAKAGAEVAA